MSEYIKREDAVRVINGQNSFTMSRANIIDQLNAIPAFDAAPVVHGKWKLLHKGDWTSVYVCSVCGRRETITESERYDSAYKIMKNCPFCHCGTKMDGGADHA